MSRFLRALAFLVAVCCLTWVGVLWWWQRTGRSIEVQDVVIYLGLLPLALMLVVLAMRWAWSSAGARQAMLAGSPPHANAGNSTSLVPVEGVDERARHAVVQLVQAAMLCTVGDQVSDLLEAVADGKPLPQPNAELHNEAGLPVLSACIPDGLLQLAMTRLLLDELLPQVQQQTEWHSQELADDVVRALSALRQPLLSQCEWLKNLISLETETLVATTTAPPNWADSVKKLVTPDLKNIRRGHLKVTGSTVDVVGQTSNVAMREKIATNMVASLNPTYTVNNKLQVSDAPQARIDSILVDKIVEFESGSAVLTTVGRQVLDELIPVLKTLNGKKIQVIGHTDAVGPRQSNVTLSQDRATAVRNYLVASSVQAAGIQTLGMGPDVPLVSNATPEGRAKNRRIEFKVMP